MKLTFLIIAAALLTACSTAKPELQSLQADLIVAGQITSVAELTFFEGDVAIVADVYEFAPQSAPSKPIKFIRGAGPCTPSENAGQYYLVFLRRHSRALALTNSDEPKDFENLMNLETAICLPISKDDLVAIRANK